MNNSNEPGTAAAGQQRERTKPLKRMLAEIIFDSQNAASYAAAELIDHGFDVELLHDRIDVFGSSFWIIARTLSRSNEGEFFDYIDKLVDPLGGPVLEAGYDQPPPMA